MTYNASVSHLCICFFLLAFCLHFKQSLSLHLLGLLLEMQKVSLSSWPAAFSSFRLQLKCQRGAARTLWPQQHHPTHLPPSHPSSLALVCTQQWHLSFLFLPQVGYKLLGELSYFDIFWAGTVPDQQ